MTLPKKNRRNIVVDDHQYHWHCCGGFNDAYVRVQAASGKGGLLNVQFVGYATPKHIEQAIRFGLDQGWSPNGKESIEIGGSDENTSIEYELKPDGASRTWFFDRFPFVMIPANSPPLPATGQITFLQHIPPGAREVSGSDAGDRFGPDLIIEFVASISAIDHWLGSCEDTCDVQPEYDGNVRTYSLQRTGDFQFAQISVNDDTGQVNVHCKPNIIPRR